ncbi:family c-likeg- -coupled receptor protein [Rutstroemia sp. NJR-2017a BBW]|nr:family c-likeg- -coupled receptor protein [Rutstroemia sp. NJR-2017a BBW]
MNTPLANSTPVVSPQEATVTLVSVTTAVSTASILSTIIEASTIIQAASPAVQPLPTTITIEVTETPSPSAAMGMEVGTMNGTGIGTQAGTNNNPAEPPTSSPSSSPALQGAGVNTPKLPPTITQPNKGPFSPVAAILGGIPNKKVDVPITAVFLVLFVIGAASHFIRHEINSKRGHKFVMSDMIFDFCMVRNVTCIMRIVWALNPKNNSIVVAALIFENAGVVVLFAVNIIFTQRIIRAKHPAIGWNPLVSKFFLIMLISVPLIIFWNIISLTVSFFTLNEKSLRTTKNLLLFGGCWTLFLSIFPAIFVSLATAIPSPSTVEKFGTGRFRTKCIILVLATAALATGAITRLLGAVLERPIDQPSHLFSKPVFYTTGFMLEIIVVYSYLFTRVDLRFWVPNGATGPGDYTVKTESDQEKLVGNTIEEKTEAPSADYDGARSMEDQVRLAVERLNVDTRGQVIGLPVKSDDSEIILYAFKQTEDLDDGFPRRPPRSSVWMGKSRLSDAPDPEYNEYM